MTDWPSCTLVIPKFVSACCGFMRGKGLTKVGRTSTAQPTIPPGISWTYMKDMTQYLYFWKQPQKIIFDLGNLISRS